MIKEILKRSKQSDNKLLTPIVLDYMMTNELFKFDNKSIKVAINILNQEREKRRTDIFHPSGSSSCLRKQVLDIMGYKPKREEDFQLLNIFDDGKWRHFRWHLLLYRMGVSKDIEKYIKSPNIPRLAGTPDQILDLSKHYSELDGVPVGFEMKGSNDYGYKLVVNSEIPPLDYLFQVTTYMVAYNVPLYTMIFENKNNQLFYELILTTKKKYAKMFDCIYVIKPWRVFLLKQFAYMNASIDMKVLPKHECTLKKDDKLFIKCPQRYNCVRTTKERNPKTIKAIFDRKSITEKLYNKIKSQKAREFSEISK